MRLLHAARARLRLLLGRRAAEARMEEEIGFHVEMETERIMRETGTDRGEARRRALVAFGGVERHKEEMRDGRGLAWLRGLSLDLRLGVRMLAKYPGLTLVGVLGMSVAVAIGAVSFGIIYTVASTSVPLDDGGRIVAVQNLDVRQNDGAPRTHLHDLVAWREALTAVGELGAYRTVDRNLITLGARPEPVRVAEMTASGFRVARVPPLFGRYFNEDDERPGAPPVVVIGYGVWQGRFAGQPDVVGRVLRLGSTAHTVVGVMPQGFAFPINNRVWTPLRLDPTRFERGDAPPIQLFGRLAPGATLDDAQAQLTTISKRLAAEHPETHEHVRGRVLLYASAFLDNPEFAWVFHVAQFMVTLLLVVIGTNVAILVYARTASRTGEIAVRSALGASRGRIVSQLFAEALVLSGAAAAVGLGGAWLALRQVDAVVARLGGEQVPFWMDFGLSPGTLLYVTGLAVLGAVIVGVLPALGATRRRVHANLQQLGPGGGSGMRLGKRWTVMVVAQVAVAVALLPIVLYATVVQRPGPGAGGPAFPTREFLVAALHLDREGVGTDDSYALTGDPAARYAHLRAELVRRLEAEPGIAAVVVSSAVPGEEPNIRIEVDGAGQSAVHVVGSAQVDLGFFAAFEIPLRIGRPFRPGDAPTLPFADAQGRAGQAIIVNQAFVTKVLGGGAPLGRRVRRARDGAAAAGAPGAESEPWQEIVGVVPDFPAPADPRLLEPRMYEPLRADASGPAARRTVVGRALSGARPTVPGAVRPLRLAVRVRGAPPASVTGRLRELAVAVDPMLRLGDVRALDESASMERMLDRLIFVGVALVTLSVVLLSAAGIYALMSFTITQRRREIGIRTALGAGARHVLGSVLAGAARQIGIGIAVGTAMAGLMVQGLEGGMGDRRGALLLVAVAAFMAAVGLAAALGPARRALRIQPTEALRAE